MRCTVMLAFIYVNIATARHSSVTLVAGGLLLSWLESMWQWQKAFVLCEVICCNLVLLIIWSASHLQYGIHGNLNTNKTSKIPITVERAYLLQLQYKNGDYMVGTSSG